MSRICRGRHPVSNKIRENANLSRLSLLASSEIKISGRETLFKLLRDSMPDDKEIVVVLFVDSALNLIQVDVPAEGDVGSCRVDLGFIVTRGRLANAAGYFLVHNHPSGNCEPSIRDVALTKRLAEASDLCDIPLLCHAVVTKSEIKTVGFW